jgi:hypothetical protein
VYSAVPGASSIFLRALARRFVDPEANGQS